MSINGFTLIELLVSLAIVFLMAGGILARYDTYTKSQKLKQAALTLKNDLRLAQSKASSAVKPDTGCTELTGYTVAFPTSATYTLQASCTEGPVGELTTVTLPEGITFSSPPASILFGVLTRGIAQDVTITLTGSGRTYGVRVNRSGDINDLGFQ